MKLKIKSLINKLKDKQQQKKAEKALKNKKENYCQEFSVEFGSLDSDDEYLDYPIIPDLRNIFTPKYIISDDSDDVSLGDI